MSSPFTEPWSNYTGAPTSPHRFYTNGEKENLAGYFVNAISYGLAVFLFFQCMGALLQPTNRDKEGIKWSLVAHTAAMFAFATIATAINLEIQSICYIDNREFPGVDGTLPPGALAYQQLIHSNAISVVPNTMLLLNASLSDGLLLYRCWVIYAMKYWVIAFPCLMYTASLAMGVTLIYYQASRTASMDILSTYTELDTLYFTISIFLSVLITSMIITRLVMHQGSIRKAMGAPATANGLCSVVLAVLVESRALYVINFLLFIGARGAGDGIANVFSPLLTETQVIAPFLIVLRVANRSALTGHDIDPENLDSIGPGSREESTVGDDAPADWDSTGSLVGYGEASGEDSVWVETAIDEVPS